MKTVMLLLASTILALGTWELAIRVFDLFAPARAEIAQAGLDGSRLATAPASDKQLHPFWGWRVRYNAKPRQPYRYQPPGKRNRFGFISTIEDYRDVRDSDFAIGIFGGSVARGIASFGGGEIVKEVERARPDLAGRIRILDFASGSYKQPQQLMVLSEMILLGVHLDFVVNVDGLNEVALGGRDASAGHHPLFPARAQMMALVDFARGVPSEAFFETSAEIIRQRRAAQNLESHANDWWFHSQLVRAFAGGIVEHYQRRADELEAELQSTLIHNPDSGLVASLPDECLERKSGCMDLIADIWMRSSSLLAAQAASIGAGYLHALQPNQYVAGSKHFTDEELRLAFAPGSLWMRTVPVGYPLLKERARVLSASGIDFLDLTTAFADVTDTLYVDSCCHMNPTGSAMLGERIGRRIAERLSSARPKPEERRIPSAGSRH